MLVLSKCWLLHGPDRPSVFLWAFWGCESESSPMAPWPLTQRGRSHQMWSVCWDSGEGQLGLTRGGPVSPNCHREHGQRGSVSTVINHTPSLSLSLSHFSHFFVLSPSHSHYFLLPLSLTSSHFLSISVLLFAVMFVSLFFFFPLRYPLFHFGYQLSSRQSHTVRACYFSHPSHVHTLTFQVYFFPNLFHLVSTCPLDWKSRCSGRTHYLIPTPKGRHSLRFIIPRESDLSGGEIKKGTKEQIRRTKIGIIKKIYRTLKTTCVCLSMWIV